jgi:hypothetical protein
MNCFPLRAEIISLLQTHMNMFRLKQTSEIYKTKRAKTDNFLILSLHPKTHIIHSTGKPHLQRQRSRKAHETRNKMLRQLKICWPHKIFMKFSFLSQQKLHLQLKQREIVAKWITETT